MSESAFEAVARCSKTLKLDFCAEEFVYMAQDRCCGGCISALKHQEDGNDDPDASALEQTPAEGSKGF